MRILMLSAAYTGGVGGVARHVVTLCRELVKVPDVTVHVLTLAKRDEPDKLQRRGCLSEWKLRRETVDEYSGRRAVFGRLFQLLAAEWFHLKADIVHAHDFDSLVLGSMLRCAFGVPLVVTVHRAPTEWRPKRFQEDAKDCLLEIARNQLLVDGVIVPSEASARVLRAQGFKDISVIPHGINKHLFSFESDPAFLPGLGIPEGRKLVFCPVRPDEHKDPYTVIRAAALLKKLGGEMPFFLLLDDQESPEVSRELRAIASARSLPEGNDIAFVRPLAYGRELATVLRASDLIVIPSIHESFGQNVLDAFMFAKPVIARNSMALGELIRHGENGLLFSTSDELATSLHRLLRDAELAAQLGDQGQRDNEGLYPPHEMAGRYLSIYVAVVSKATQSRQKMRKSAIKKGPLAAAPARERPR